MNSLEIKRNLENIKQRTVEAQTRLKSETDLDTALQVQRDLTDLQSYQSRLESELVATLRAETLTKKKLEADALETGLADLEAQCHDLERDMQHRVREAVPQLQALLGDLKPLQSERFRLNKEHESLYLKRFNDWPQKGLVNGMALIPFTGLTEAEQVLVFALGLLDAEKTKHGTTFQDVLRALSSVSQRFGF
jgi:DNA repair exonuclease SbcCD ATPase subunit